MSTKSIVRMRKGRPTTFSYDLVLWRRRRGPGVLAAAVSQQKALNAARTPQGEKDSGVDPELLRLLRLINPRA